MDKVVIQKQVNKQNETKKKEEDLTKGKILPTLLKFALPILLALFLQAMYGAVDLLVVGHFGTTEDVSGVSTGSMFIQSVTMVITGLAMGITVLIGQAIGKKDEALAAKSIGSGICLFFVVGVLTTLFLTLLTPILTTLLKAPPSAIQETKTYIFVCGIGTIFIVAYNVIGSVFRGLGDSNTPLLTVFIACIVNIVGDLVLIKYFHLGSFGAALATVFAQAVSVILSFVILKKKGLPFAFTKKDIHWDSNVTKKIIQLGFPIALQEFLVGLSFLFIQSTVNAIGVEQSAGVGVAEKVCAFLMLVSSSFMQAMSAFVAQNLGANQPVRAKKALFYGIITSFLMGIVMGYLAFFQGDRLASLFDKNIGVISYAKDYLKAYGIDCLLTAVLFCFMGYFNGCQKTLFVMIQGLIGAFCVRIPIVYFVSKIPNVNLFYLGLGTPCSTVVQIILCVSVFLILQKKLAKQSH